MASTIVTKNSSTASAVPVAGDLTKGELAVNVTDKRLFTKDNSGSVVELGINPSSLTLSGGTANGVGYLNGSKQFTTGSALTFDGTTLANINSDGTGFSTQSAASNFSIMRLGTDSVNGYAFFQSGKSGTGTTLPFAWRQDSSELMRLTSTGLGIGTSSPGATLHVAGSSGSVLIQPTNVASALLNMRHGSIATNNYFKVDSTSTTIFGTSGTDKAYLDSSGNLGLGVTPSAWFASNKALQINTTGVLSSYTNGANIQTFLANNAFWNASGTISYITSNTATSYTQDNGAHKWYYAASGTAGNAITFTQAMTLDASGNLAIGLTSASARLHLGGSTNNEIRVDTTASGYLQLGQFSNGAFIGTSSADATAGVLRLGTAGSERARIDSSGSLLVGQTASINSEILGATKAGNVFLVKNTQNTGTARLVYQNGAGVIDYFYNYAGSSELGTISNTTTSVAYNTSSDYRLKNIDGPLTGSGEFIDALKPKVGTWKIDGSRFVGFIAHEVQEVSPSSVVGEKDGERMQAMEYGSAEFIANIVAELQSLRKRVAQLEGK